MTELTLLAKGLTTHLSALRPFFPDPVDVLITNVAYYDDVEMQGHIKGRQANFPKDTRFFTSMHELGRPVTNFVGDTLVIDCLNLYVSNNLLLNNSDPRLTEHMATQMTADIQHFLDAFHAGQLDMRRLIILTGDVDFDYFIRTEAGLMYRELLHRINSLIAPVAHNYGILTNGTILWIKQNAVL